MSWFSSYYCALNCFCFLVKYFSLTKNELPAERTWALDHEDQFQQRFFLQSTNTIYIYISPATYHLYSPGTCKFPVHLQKALDGIATLATRFSHPPACSEPPAHGCAAGGARRTPERFRSGLRPLGQRPRARHVRARAAVVVLRDGRIYQSLKALPVSAPPPRAHRFWAGRRQVPPRVARHRATCRRRSSFNFFGPRRPSGGPGAPPPDRASHEILTCVGLG